MTQTTGREPDRAAPSREEGLPGAVPAAQTTLPHGVAGSVVRRSARQRRLELLESAVHDLLARRWVAESVVASICAMVFVWRVGSPSPWWDEAITRDVTSRQATDIIDLTEHVDLVHATYYLLVHALLGSSASITPIRLLSVVAAVITGILLVRLGRELGSGRVGFAAGLFWVTAPLASRYAQEARPYAMVAMIATASTLALVRVCRKPWLRRRWALYATSLVLLGLFNVIGLTILVTHAGYVLATSARRVRLRWIAATAACLVLVSPLLWFSSRQSAQVSWLPVPPFDRLTGFFDAEYVVGWAVVALLVVAAAGLGRGTHSPALALGLAWSVLPPVVLWTISQSHPLFDWRYVFYTVPGTALALASLATALRARYLAVAVLVLAIGGAHMQDVYRWRATGHAENLRGVAETIRDGARPGDAVIFLPASRRVVKLAYPDDFAGVDDVALAETDEQSDTLWGVEEPAKDLSESLTERTRVWVVTSAPRLGETADPAETEKERLLYDDFRLTGQVDLGSYEVEIYDRSSKEAAITSAGPASS